MGYYDIEDESIEEVVENWVEGNKAYDPRGTRAHGWYSPEEVFPYREYAWTRYRSRLSPEEWDDLTDSMLEHGWYADEPLYLLVGKDGKAQVGEGNHRLAIAMQIGLEEIPVNFQFYRSVEGGVPVVG